MKIKKILIANRAEIACRIIRTCARLDIRTVAIYSDADRKSPHVSMADEAYHVGPAAPNLSYLNIEKILAVAKKSKTDAIHPGYGFLSENETFARRVQDAGLIFIGPSPKTIALMGNKLDAKATLNGYDIPMVPGSDLAVTDIDQAVHFADKIGLPVLIKAAAGGGGKGMRKITNLNTIKSDMERAMSEAKNAFGDASVFIEKFIENPRHIEIQILADHYGHTVHLFERECSIQRRHQKVIEEAPSTLLTDDMRTQMGQAAVQVARSCDYTGVGTVEFLVDATGSFYFLEMNTRLQVEHPVTEMITGLDLVEQQIKVAQNEALSFKQSDLKPKGHSIELRVYAEDPKAGFVPSVGRLVQYNPPVAPYIRLDDGYREGMDIPIAYDPMISKLIVTGADRSDAIHKMIQAISQYHIEGVATTLDFGRFVMQHPAFINGEYDTNFVEKYFITESISNRSNKIASLIGVALYNRLKQQP